MSTDYSYSLQHPKSIPTSMMPEGEVEEEEEEEKEEEEDPPPVRKKLKLSEAEVGM